MPRISAHLGTALLPLLASAMLSVPAGAASLQSASQDVAQGPITRQIDCRNRSTSDEEVVVCGRRNGEDPYRLPKEFRKAPRQQSGGATLLDAMGSAIPNSNSNVGPAGSVGQYKDMAAQWRAERDQARADNPE